MGEGDKEAMWWIRGPQHTIQPRASVRLRATLAPISVAAIVSLLALAAYYAPKALHSTAVGQVSAPASQSEPELGTSVPSPELKAALSRYKGPNGNAEQPSSVDVLGRVNLPSDVLTAVGFHRSDGIACFGDYLSSAPADASVGCLSRSQIAAHPLAAIRSLGASGNGDGLIEGFAPPSTTEIRLLASNGSQLAVAPYAAGQRWAGASYYLAKWPSDVATTVTALDRNGRVLAVTESPGIS